MTVEMERQLHLQDDHMSGNWSFGSNYHPCSQPRKISIGVVVDSTAKMKGKHGKEVVAELQPSENITIAKDIPAESKHKGKEVMSPDLGRQNKAPCQESSPLVRAKTSNQNISYSDTFGYPRKVASLPSTSNVLLQPSSSKVVGELEPVNQMFNLHATDVNEKKSNRNTLQREGGNLGIMGREESSYGTAEKVFVPEKGIKEQGTRERGNGGNLTLRRKVQELLGTVYSPDKKLYSSEISGMENSKPKSKTHQNESLVAMHRQHMHTRETNSGSLGRKMRRPVTRSLTHKNPQPQKSVPKKQVQFCRNKQTHLDMNTFSFVETLSRRPSTDVNHGTTLCKRKERETYGTRPVKTCSVEGVHKDDSQQATDWRKIKAAAINVSLLENRTGESEIVKPNTRRKETTHHQFEVIMTRHQPGGNNGTTLHNNVDQDPFAKHSLTKDVGPQYDLKSPTFELKEAAEISSPRSLFQNNQEDLAVDSPPERALNTKGICSSPGIGFSKGGYYRANTKNPAMDFREPPVKKPATLIIGGHKESRCSRSPSKEVQFENSEDGSPVSVPIILENCKGNRWSTSPCQEEDPESLEYGSPIKGDGDCDNFHNSSEPNGLAGAVNLFALALERVQSKIHSIASRQSAEILLSVSKNIHWQLQNAESKIQNEVGKLTNLGKSKRMRPENRCQEQQEQLKLIYEKFKEEVDRHLENCRSAVEGLEAHHIEVRGMVEKQRLSHRKLLLQTEEAIETQLNDAQSRLADVRRLAREKLLKLKYGIGECLKEGLLG
ncbi:meiosis-specific protein ASY3 [Cynara cardunculus var. scolymus]|uniref:meiosis-specific protein ASY3 n=1 Tax=Cynara cardunculus var. scolymus TaxID=59895 RepID=UPI000D62EBF4|nr:meiosis-specific protein ASY3 [Cynara cardunculus var. scolymus]